MPNEQQQQQQQRQPDKDKPLDPPRQERGGRSGEGSRSVLPHLKADQRARAVARIEKRAHRDF